MSTKEYQVIKINPCEGGAEKNCYICRWKGFDMKDFCFEYPYCDGDGDVVDWYPRLVNLFVGLGPLCLKCLETQMETRNEIILHCKDGTCQYHWASYIYVSGLKVSTEPSFSIYIYDSYYCFPSKRILIRNDKVCVPEQFLDILGLYSRD